MSYKLPLSLTSLSKYILFDVNIPTILKLYLETCTETQQYFQHHFQLNYFQHHQSTKGCDTLTAIHFITIL
jgi:hypothetical protein